jgi:cation transport ATPase
MIQAPEAQNLPLPSIIVSPKLITPDNIGKTPNKVTHSKDSPAASSSSKKQSSKSKKKKLYYKPWLCWILSVLAMVMMIMMMCVLRHLLLLLMILREIILVIQVLILKDIFQELKIFNLQAKLLHCFEIIRRQSCCTSLLLLCKQSCYKMMIRINFRIFSLFK